MENMNSLLELMHLSIFFILSFIRIFSFFFFIPMFGEEFLNNKIRFFFSLSLGFSIFFIIPFHNQSFNFILIIFLSLHELLIGFVLGFLIKLIFSISILSGEIISSQIGISFANFFDFNARMNISVITRFLNLFSLYIFLSLNGHLWIINILIQSFYKIPIELNIFNTKNFLKIVQFMSIIFLKSMLLVQPIIIFMFTLMITLAFLNRISPQISVFSIFFPMTVLSGCYLIYISIPIFNIFFEKVFFELFTNIQNHFLLLH
ncbi:flagellar biosynthetic protein FliR [Buchnera aphidicola (Thelaxes californica)]|uniref:Flagellar biosynthetic protein FliR n=1 Tax=Buchnera aphidicola (Thelaxes californica) TaxID=1315998 RepID=A0A4D6YKX0_9GAMM|nr:flagellar biosynthetic protein FliR [Buchnera aphidicola]QCI26624.1 flagellar biosynthetic protein FliR [Buchnera aphidicola (Thelaxes californica)]